MTEPHTDNSPRPKDPGTRKIFSTIGLEAWLHLADLSDTLLAKDVQRTYILLFAKYV